MLQSSTFSLLGSMGSVYCEPNLNLSLILVLAFRRPVLPEIMVFAIETYDRATGSLVEAIRGYFPSERWHRAWARSRKASKRCGAELLAVHGVAGELSGVEAGFRLFGFDSLPSYFLALVRKNLCETAVSPIAESC